MFLEHFLISKVRIKILKLFFLNLDKSYHVREVVRQVDEEINAVRRELKNLEAVKLLTSAKDANKVVYSLDKSHTLFCDLLSLVHKEFGLGGYFFLHRDEIGDVKYAMITRTFIKGIKMDPHNVDFVVVGKVDMQSLATAMKHAEKDLGKEIHYTVMTEDEFEYRKNKRDAFLLNILAGSLVMLVGDLDEMLSSE